MADEKSSCLKKIGCGCLGLAGLGIVAAILLGMVASQYQPSPAEMVSDEQVEVLPFEEHDLPELDTRSSEGKNVRLFLDMSIAHFKLVPDAPDGQITIEHEYDKANFKLETRTEKNENGFDYHLDFGLAKPAWSMAWNANSTREKNRIVIHLPKDMVFAIKMRSDKGNYDLDLSGLSVAALDLNMKMGNMSVEMKEPNPVPMEEMEVQLKMGNTTLDDYQNLGFTEGRLRGSMGEFRLRNSGPIEEALKLDVKVRMMGARIEIPENVTLDSKLINKVGSEFVQPSPPEGDPQGTMMLEGSVSMGELQVVRRTR